MDWPKCKHGDADRTKWGQCRICLKARRATPEFKAADAERRATPERKASRATPERKARRNDKRRERKTGWSSAAVEAAWVAQGGKCAGCGIAMVHGGTGALSMVADHCHKTDKPRWLLHRRCNTVIGQVYENPAVLRRLADLLDTLAPGDEGVLPPGQWPYRRLDNYAASDPSISSPAAAPRKSFLFRAFRRTGTGC
jgi:hypothetical protein